MNESWKVYKNENKKFIFIIRNINKTDDNIYYEMKK